MPLLSMPSRGSVSQKVLCRTGGAMDWRTEPSEVQPGAEPSTVPGRSAWPSAAPACVPLMEDEDDDDDDFMWDDDEDEDENAESEDEELEEEFDYDDDEDAFDDEDALDDDEDDEP